MRVGRAVSSECFLSLASMFAFFLHFSLILFFFPTIFRPFSFLSLLLLQQCSDLAWRRPLTTHRQSDLTYNTHTAIQPWSYEHLCLCALSAPYRVLLIWTSHLVFFLSGAHFLFSGCLSVWHFAYSHIPLALSFRFPYSEVRFSPPVWPVFAVRARASICAILACHSPIFIFIFICFLSSYTLTWTWEVLSWHIGVGRCLEPR